MKKVTSWFLLMTLLLSMWALPMAVSAEETTTEDTTTEDTTTESKQVVHFKLDFENYSTSTGSFPNAETTGYGNGSWTEYEAMHGNAVDGIDGKAFHFTDTTGYATYNPTADVTTGKWLWSFDIAYNPDGTYTTRKTWLMNNESPTYLYFLALQDPKSTSVSSVTAAWSNSSGAVRNKGNLFKSTDSEKEYTVDILLDFDNNLATYYVDGVKKTSNKMSDATTYTFKGTSFKLNMTNNINKFDNFMLIENPDAQYSFAQKGDVTTESEYITVRFSDTVLLTDINDFIITDADGATAATVTEIEQVNGKFYNLKLSNKLAAGTYNLTLNDTTLTSVIAGTTSSNTTSEFTVALERTYFDIDFEEYTTSSAASTYYNTFNQYGKFALANSNDQTKNNTYGFAGDDSMGITCSSSGTRNMSYTPTEPIASGKVVVSYDAAFDATRLTGRQQLSYVDDAENGCILTYGILGNVTVIAGAKEGTLHYSGGGTKSYVNNQAYRWDTVIDLDGKTITNYCDGVQFNKVTYTSSYLVDGITTLYLRFKPSLTFFDNYKMTVNVDNFGYTASDIDESSNATVMNFDDTMVLEATDLVFTDPNGATVTPTSITKITPRKYKVVLPDLVAGTYTVALAEGVTSAIGNEPKIESTTFTVAERLENTFIATNLAFGEAEGGASLTATLTNTTDANRQALLLIGVYDEDEMIECHAERMDVAAGETDVTRTTTYTTELDLTGYTVRGFVWNIDELFYAMYDAIDR